MYGRQKVHDAVKQVLLYAPAAGVGAPTTTTVPRLTQLALTDGGSDISLHDMTFEHSAASFKSCYTSGSYCEAQSAADQDVAALHWIRSNRVFLTNLTVQHTGGYG
jgi:hypothetical protein